MSLKDFMNRDSDLVGAVQLSIMEGLLINAEIPQSEIREIEAMLVDSELTIEKASLVIRYLKDHQAQEKNLDGDFDKMYKRKLN